MIEIRVPTLPESVADATLVSWHKQPGEAVGRDENLADLETDKVVLEVPAPANGVIKEIRVQNGTTVTSGQVLAIIEEGAVAAKPAAAAAAAQAPVHGNGSASSSAPAAAAAATDADKLSPAVRRMVEENKLDPGSIPASGKDGRLTKADVSNFIDRKVAPAAPAAAPAASAPPAAKPAAAKSPTAPPAPRPVGARTEHRVAMTRLRTRIAERMVQAQSTQALLTTFNEVDLHAVQDLRARYKEKFEKSHGVKLGFSSFFVKATVEALKKFPIVNASIDGSDIVYREFYDIGVAVSTDRGLIVPVLRDADALSFADIEKAIGNFAARAREGSITIEELTGGTFSITNGGVFGSLLSTPIVNAPQSAILGMHSIQQRPVAIDGQVVIRPMMYLAVTYDHRIIDGRDAVQFLVAIKDALEDPGRMLLGL